MKKKEKTKRNTGGLTRLTPTEKFREDAIKKAKQSFAEYNLPGKWVEDSTVVTIVKKGIIPTVTKDGTVIAPESIRLDITITLFRDPLGEQITSKTPPHKKVDILQRSQSKGNYFMYSFEEVVESMFGHTLLTAPPKKRQ